MLRAARTHKDIATAMETTKNPMDQQIHVNDVDKPLIDELIRHNDNLTKILKSRRGDDFSRKEPQGSVFTRAY